MKNLIPSKDNSIEPNGAIGKQKCGIIFWQDSRLFHRFSKRKLKWLINMIGQKYSPTKVEKGIWWYFIKFDHNDEKIIYLTIRKKHFRTFLYGESHTTYVGADFHIFVLELISYISTELDCKIFVDDATGYLEHRSIDKLKNYIDNLEIVIPESSDLLHKEIIKNQNAKERQ